MEYLDNRPVREAGNYDVIVVGGGIAGVAAAVAAGRAGARTLLIEKAINLGGLATTGLISWYEPLCDGRGEQMVFGIAEELIRLAVGCGLNNLPPVWGGNSGTKTRNERFSTRFSPTIFPLVLDEYVEAAGVELRFDTQVVCPIMKDDRCVGLLGESMSGREFFGAKAVIDATGAASVAHAAGMETVDGQNYFSFVMHGFTRAEAAEFAEDGDLARFRHWIWVGSDLYGRGQPEGMPPLSGTTADDVTTYVRMTKRAALERVRREAVGEFELMTIPYQPQFRTIRRIVGAADFCAVDGEVFADSIGRTGDFRRPHIGKHYQIPYRALYHPACANILAAGRVISAPQGNGWEVARVIPTCALTGQAAGTAAAMIAREGCRAAELDVEALQRRLEADGVKL